MFKFIGLMVMGLSFIASNIFAQSFTSSPASSTENKANNLLPNVKVMSPSDFKSQVNTKNKQTQDELMKQIDKMLPKKPPTNPSSPPPPESAEHHEKDSASTQPPPAVVTETSAPQVQTPEPVTETATPPIPSPPPAQANGSSPSSSTTSTQPRQAQPYTGFSNSTPESTKEEQSQGGWNVKY